MAFTLQEDGASLTVSRGPLALDLNLSKVPGPEAATRLQALTLGLAERVCSLERRLTGGIGGGYPAASLGAPFPCLHSWLFSQLQRRPLPAPGRALGWWGLSNSYQVRTVTCDRLGLCSFLCDSIPPKQDSGSRDRFLCGEEGEDLGSSWIQVLPHPVSPRPGSSERHPWTWRQEAVSWRVPHQPWLQEVPTHCPSLLWPGSSPGPCPSLHTSIMYPLFFSSKKPASGVDFDDL